MKIAAQICLVFLCCVLYRAAIAFEKKEVVVALDWFINPNHAALVVAEQEGFFEKQGINVKFMLPADAGYAEKMVSAGKADIAVTYQTVLEQHVARGLPLVQFATLIDTPLSCLVVLDGGKIKNLSDLKGKRIGYSDPVADVRTLTRMLEFVKLKPQDVELINVKFNLNQALLSGRVDGFMGGMRNFEPIAIELSGKKAKMFYPEQYGIPKYSELVLVVHKDRISEKWLGRFIEGLRQGVRYLKSNPDKSWQKFIVGYPELNNELNKRSWFMTAPYFADEPMFRNKQILASSTLKK